MPVVPWWKLALKFWYVVPLVLLLGLFLWQRNELTGTKADLVASKAREQDLQLANQSAQAALSQVRLARIDNDAIALQVAAKVGRAKDTETHTETIIEKAVANDPVAKSWADQPLPPTVRDALHA
jgi:hypothetical protein